MFIINKYLLLEEYFRMELMKYTYLKLRIYVFVSRKN